MGCSTDVNVVRMGNYPLTLPYKKCIILLKNTKIYIEFVIYFDEYDDNSGFTRMITVVYIEFNRYLSL